MLSKYFIERPVLGNVIALITMLIGAVSIFGLPIAQYPPMTPPTIQVTTTWPGASASLIQQLVASNIETQVNGVDGMLYMESDSTNNGSYTLTVTFQVGTDPDLAQVNVQNRVAIALPALPQAVQKQGVTTKTQSTAILQIVTLTSPISSYKTAWPGFLAWPPPTCLASVTTACGSGSIRRNSRRATCNRPT